MNLPLRNHSADYILEKWEKYIGVKPKKIKLPTVNAINKNKHFYNEELTLWIGLWHRKTEYDDVKEIINFILLVNSRFFPEDEHHRRWSPTELVSAFRDNVGDPNLINNEPYNHLHALIIRKVDSWLEDKEIYRDYKLNILV
jgi:hypothetical protein